ncbi:hypothetical protein [Pontivivens ytuae]|uniref:Uncharacterized protein n=1 Tax=Pontivivens ytuae TaxID=2789856 RepID=A0A7S9QC88_9RHOB|nr:hypothetical protein [Pontivivens ytuae]QPH53137.1 hypothetical protein I0K15_15205 [Pontivivens ytuae]
MNSSGPYLDIGIAQTEEESRVDSIFEPQRNSATAYARVVIPLGRKPERIDCIRLYEMELRRMELELQLLEMGIQ